MSNPIAVLEKDGIPKDKIEEYMAAFEMFDTDRSGTITTSKLKAVLNDTFGQSFGEEDLKYMLRQFGDENSVDFIKFAKSMHSKMANPAYNEAFADAFDLFDTGKKGELTKTELIAGMDKLGEKLTEEEAEEMLKVAAKRDDFVKIMSQGAGIGAPAAGAAAGVAPAAAAGGPARGPAGGPRPGASPRPAGGGPRPGASPRPAGGGPRPARGPRPSMPRPAR